MHTIITALMGALAFSSISAVSPMSEAQGVDYPSRTVLMTGYNAVPEQTDGDPTVTASGAYSNPAVVAARSRDLAEDLPYGTIIEIIAKEDAGHSCGLPVVEEHLGYRVIADTMHVRKKNQIDIMFDTDASVKVGSKTVNPAVALGVCEDVEIRVIGAVDIKEIPKNQATLKRVVDEQRLALKKW